MTITQQFPVNGSHKRWDVDIGAAARAAGIGVHDMTREATEMAQHFPRWLLVLVRDGQPLKFK